MEENLQNLLEMLQAWMDFNRRSPLDGTRSCEICYAMTLDGPNYDYHLAWHERSDNA
jgi:hypothetical protein